MEGFLHVQQLGRLAFGEFLHRHAGPGGHDLGDVFLCHHRGAVISRSYSHSGGSGFTANFGSLGFRLILAGLQDRADLVAQLHFLIAQFAGLGEVLLANGVFLLLLDRAKLLVDLLSGRGQLRVHQANAAAGFIDQVDGLVGQEAIRDVAVTQGGRSHQCLISDRETVVRFVALLQTPQDFDGVVNRRLTHLHRLEPTLQGGIAFDVLAVFIERGGTDALELSAGQGWLEDVGSIDGTFRRAGADQGMHLVDHEDHVSGTPDFLHDLFEALLKLTAVLGACHQQADIQGENALVFKDVGHIAGVDPLGEALGDGGFAHAGFANQHGVVLGAATQDLDDALDLVLAAHHRVELAVGGLLGEVAAELIEGGGFGGAFATATAAGDLSGLAQHADHLSAHLRQVDTQVFEHTSGHALAFANQAQQQVLGADVVVPELTGFFERQLQHPFGSWRERDFHGHEAGAAADDFFHLNAGILEVDPHRLEHLGGHAGALTDQAQQDLLGAHEVVPQAAGLLLGQHDHLDGLLCKPLEHGRGLLRVLPTYQGWPGECGVKLGSVKPTAATAFWARGFNNSSCTLLRLFASGMGGNPNLFHVL